MTNPVSRHPAVAASAGATLQAETGVRAVLSIGRGDSSVTQIGCWPVSVAELEQALETVQRYLRGLDVELDEAASAIRWLPDPKYPRVTVDVAATGPRTIAGSTACASRGW